jgi:hypothetical protein
MRQHESKSLFRQMNEAENESRPNISHRCRGTLEVIATRCDLFNERENDSFQLFAGDEDPTRRK